MSVFFVLLDAFRFDYLDEKFTPFLKRLSEEGEHYQHVVPSFGFCERTEILAGLSPQQSGFLTAVGYGPERSSIQSGAALKALSIGEKVLERQLKLLPASTASRIGKRVRSLIGQRLRRWGHSMPAFSIPYSLLPYFCLTEDFMDHRDENAFAVDSIFTLLDRAGKSYFYDSFTALGFQSKFKSDNERLNGVVESFQTHPRDLYLIYLSTPDSMGHRYGPGSQPLRDALKQMDQRLERFVGAVQSVRQDVKFVFLGDHGMLEVKGRINAEKEIQQIASRLRLRLERDYLYFLDSTTVRIWYMNDNARSQFTGALSESAAFASQGAWMDADLARRYGSPWPDRRYGDCLWVANPGVIVFPDFFHRYLPCQGMHGYDPDVSESQGMGIIWGEGVQSQRIGSIPLTQVFDLLKRDLEL